MRVLVQFGKRKEYAALVVRVLEAEEDLSLKYLINVLDERPVVLDTNSFNGTGCRLLHGSAW